MSHRLIIFDTTLRDGEQSPGASMNLEEKVRMARQIDALGVDVIEAGFPMASEDDFRAVRAVAREVRRPLGAPAADRGPGAHHARRHRAGLEGARGGRAPAHPHLRRHLRPPHEAQASQGARGGPGDGRGGGAAGEVVHAGRRVPLPRGRRRPRGGRDDDQHPRYGRLHDPGGVRPHHPDAARAGSGPRAGHALGPLPQRPRPGGRQLAGGG